MAATRRRDMRAGKKEAAAIARCRSSAGAAGRCAPPRRDAVFGTEHGASECPREVRRQQRAMASASERGERQCMFERPVPTGRYVR